MVLHNLNSKLLSDDKLDTTFKFLKGNMNDSFKIDISIIKNEFEKVIFLFRKCENYDICVIDFQLNNWSPIFYFFSELLNYKK